MKSDFKIEWPDDHGEGWMNVWNLLICLQSTCPNTHFKVTDDEGREAESERMLEEVAYG